MAVGRLMAGVAVAAALVAGPAGQSRAAVYTAEYVFGDSLSDNGNLAAVLGANFPNPPSYQDSFTNGPVANALLASRLGLSLTPSLWVKGFADPAGLFGGASFVPGTNYAVAGATAAQAALGGLSPAINLPQQVAAFGLYTKGVADPNALYVVEIGGNDVRLAARQGTGAAAVVAGVQAEVAAIATLVAEGAKNFLVVNVPNVGVIPEFVLGQTAAVAAAATAFSQAYNSQLAAGLASLTLPRGTSLTQFDLYGFNTNQLATGARYGLTNTTTPCYTATPFSATTTPACGANAENIGSFYYWDAIHPTAKVQALWATGFEDAIGVPEPSSMAVLGLGLAGLMGLRRRGVSAAR